MVMQVIITFDVDTDDYKDGDGDGVCTVSTPEEIEEAVRQMISGEVDWPEVDPKIVVTEKE